MTRIGVTSSLSLLIMAALAGCSRPDSGEHRTGRYSWDRAAKPNELKKADLFGVYSCRFAKGSSTVRLKMDGTYTLTVRADGVRSAKVGPHEWYAQDLDGKDPAVGLENFPILLAVMETRIPAQRDVNTEDTGALVYLGFNDENGLVLAIGIDPDDYYYFARSEPSSTENGESD